MYPCVCCGYLTIFDVPGSYDICGICFWEDDPVQLRYPSLGGGANGVSLIEAQRQFAAIGVSEARFLANVRSPREDDDRDPEWRPIDPARDRFEEFPSRPDQKPGLAYFLEAAGAPRADERRDWPGDMTELLWWRPNFWNWTAGW